MRSNSFPERAFPRIALIIGFLATVLTAQEPPHPEVTARLQALHTAFEQYRRDHHGVYPPLMHRDTAGRALFWPELLKPYLDDDSPRGHVDPGGPLFVPYLEPGSSRAGKVSSVSFGYPRFSLGADAPTYSGGRKPVRVVPSPADTLLLVECEALKQPGIGWYSAYPNSGIRFDCYQGKAHVLFCDGHVELWTPEQLNVGTKPTTPAPPWHGILSLNPTLTGPIPGFPAPTSDLLATDLKPPATAPRLRKAIGPPVPAATHLVTVAHIATPPVIDGHIGAEEWARFSAFSGYSSYITQRLTAEDIASFAGYDKEALYLAFVVPLAADQKANAKVTERDGRVYKEDAVEIILEPETGGDIRQLIVNAIGTVFDRRGAETAWGGDWRIATGTGIGADLPPELADLPGFWAVELALPFAELQLRTPQPGDEWRVNFCVDGQRPMVFAPTFESYLDRATFATMVFLGPDEPSLHLPTLGKLTYGKLQFRGSVRRSAPDSATIAFTVNAEKEGTRIVERTGFDEIDGALFAWEETLLVPGHGVAPIQLGTVMDDSRLDRVRIEVTAQLQDGTRTPLYRSVAGLTILPPLRLELENYPTEETIVLRVDVTGLEATEEPRRVGWRILNGENSQAMSAEFALPSRSRAETIDISSLVPGSYTLAAVVRDVTGTVQAEEKVAFVRVENPAWFRNDIGRSRTVLPPFTPIGSAARSVTVWGRAMTWSDASVLPSEITSGDTSLLAAPARLVLTVDGTEQTVALNELAVTSRSDDRVDLRISGRSAEIAAEVVGWVEVDGLLWLDVRLTTRTGQARTVDACRLEFPLARHDELYYHGVPDRSLTGRISDAPLEFQSQFYFWIGSCERGLGCVMGSDRDVSLGKDGVAHRVVPDADRVLWQVRLIERPMAVTALHYTFGLQATPVRPLPPDWHSWLTVNVRELRDPAYAEFADSLDMTTIWEQFKGAPESWWRPAFCDPMGVRTDKVKALVGEIHTRGVPAILYSSPMNFSDAARPEHAIYGHEWATIPRTRWKCAGFTQSRACASSSFQDWLLFHFRNTIRETGLDGLYFDGATSGACMNQHHGCGWLADNGDLRGTLPILANREFNRRIAVMLHEEVEPRAIDSPAAAQRPDWPRYYNWIHISGAVCPPTMSFNTAYFCGEWFKGAIKAGKGYRDLLTLDTFRPRYLSTPWGVPNFFLPITRERESKVSVETECILAYMLPHGVPIYPKYLNIDVIRTVLTAMTTFGTRAATFTPCWRTNELLQLDANGDRNVLLATWRREGAVLAVVANVGSSGASGTLHWHGKKSARMAQLFPAGDGAPRDVKPQQLVPISLPPQTFRLLDLAEPSE